MNDDTIISNTNYKNVKPYVMLDDNISAIESICGGSSDLLVNRVNVSGVQCALLGYEGMISTTTITQLILHPLMEIDIGDVSGEELFSHIKDNMLMSLDRILPDAFGKIIRLLMSGFALIFIDGTDKVIAYGVQGYATRGISEPNGEGNVKGAHEGFVEVVRTNMSLVRRRMKTPLLIFDLFPTNTESRTDVIICYMADRVPQKLVRKIKARLLKIRSDALLGSGFVEPFLSTGGKSIFPGVSVTERPDVFCAKLCEGKIGVMIEGTPYAIFLPCLFTEHFQTLDDYNFRAGYASYLRIIRYLAFFISVFFPAVYVATATFHPEMLNLTMLMQLAAEESAAPLPLMFEMILVLVMYEVIKEAGLRLPQNVGGAVSIVGGLIIGDAAVKSGLISTPLLITAAISVTASFVIPNLNSQMTLIRLILVLVGGFTGLCGIAVVTAVILVNICSTDSFGAPVTAPLSPLTLSSLRDVLWRKSFVRIADEKSTVEKLNGVDMD